MGKEGEILVLLDSTLLGHLEIASQRFRFLGVSTFHFSTSGTQIVLMNLRPLPHLDE